MLYYRPVPRNRSAGSCWSIAQLGWALAFAAGVGAATFFVVNYQLSLPLRAAAAMLAIAPGVGYIVAMVRDVRRLDELQQRIYLEAVSVACAGTFLFTLLYPTLRRAGLAPEMSPTPVALVIVALASVSYLVAKRRFE